MLSSASRSVVCTSFYDRPSYNSSMCLDGIMATAIPKGFINQGLPVKHCTVFPTHDFALRLRGINFVCLFSHVKVVIYLGQVLWRRMAQGTIHYCILKSLLSLSVKYRQAGFDLPQHSIFLNFRRLCTNKYCLLLFSLYIARLWRE